MRIVPIVSALFILLMASCSVQKRSSVNYLENVSDTSITGLMMPPEPVIRKNDLLSIVVYSSSINPLVDAPYNLPATVAGAGSQAGFLVDANGNIEYPRLGMIKVEGLSKSALENLIKTKLEGQLNNPTVVIRFLNYRITILGEVNTPGTFNVPTERINILEALGLAGDVTEFGKRNTIKVLRDFEGRREMATIDLTKGAFFNSPYFQLQQNDVVFVEQTPEKLKQRSQQNVAQQIGIASSIITAIALILNFIK